MLNIENPTEYLVALLVMPIVWAILVVGFPFYLIGYLIILIHKRYGSSKTKDFARRGE